MARMGAGTTTDARPSPQSLCISIQDSILALLREETPCSRNALSGPEHVTVNKGSWARSQWDGGSIFWSTLIILEGGWQHFRRWFVVYVARNNSFRGNWRASGPPFRRWNLAVRLFRPSRFVSGAEDVPQDAKTPRPQVGSERCRPRPEGLSRPHRRSGGLLRGLRKRRSKPQQH